LAPLDADPIRVTGLWVRHTYPGSAPLPLRHPAPDNRWQRGAVVDALYLAAEEATAWAEWYRHLAELGVPPNAQMPRDVWTWRVDVEVADLSDAARLARAGLEAPRPGRRTWPPHQEAGEALAAAGWAGLVAPSAARPAHRILCLFRRGAGPIAGAAPSRRPRQVEQPPPPPPGMVT